MIALWIGAAFAVDAEGERIAEDLLASMQERQWNAVERKYQKLAQSYPDALTGLHHSAAAESARVRGALLTMAQRLSRIDADSEVEGHRKEVQLLSATTGLVQIACPIGSEVHPQAFPFQPDLRAAIELAQSEVKSSGVFVGLLPIGIYDVCGQSAEVKPGQEWQVFLGPLSGSD